MTSDVMDENSSAKLNMVSSPETGLSFGTSDGGSREGSGVLDFQQPPRGGVFALGVLPGIPDQEVVCDENPVPEQEVMSPTPLGAGNADKWTSPPRTTWHYDRGIWQRNDKEAGRDDDGWLGGHLDPTDSEVLDLHEDTFMDFASQFGMTFDGDGGQGAPETPGGQEQTWFVMKAIMKGVAERVEEGMKRSRRREEKIENALGCLSMNVKRAVKAIEDQAGAVRSGLQQHHEYLRRADERLEILGQGVHAQGVERADSERIWFL